MEPHPRASASGPKKLQSVQATRTDSPLLVEPTANFTAIIPGKHLAIVLYNMYFNYRPFFLLYGVTFLNLDLDTNETC